jgi:hypothetical protein
VFEEEKNKEKKYIVIPDPAFPTYVTITLPKKEEKWVQKVDESKEKFKPDSLRLRNRNIVSKEDKGSFSNMK